MRTTLNIDDELHAQLKRLAGATGRTITELLEDAIRGLLADVRQASEADVPDFPTFDGGQRPGLLPGVQIDSKAALADVMGDDAAA